MNVAWKQLQGAISLLRYLRQKNNAAFHERWEKTFCQYSTTCLILHITWSTLVWFTFIQSVNAFIQSLLHANEEYWEQIIIRSTNIYMHNGKFK